MQWFYANGGEQVGPLDDTEFHERIRGGQITAETPVWREGMPSWVPYGQVSGRKATQEPKKKLVLQRDAGAPPLTADTAEGAAMGQADAGGALPGGPPKAMGSASVAANILYRAKGWIRLIGVLALIMGILQALTVIGLIIAWIPVWIGVLLCSASSRIAEAHEQGDELALAVAVDKIRLYFKIVGIFALIGLVFMVIGLVASIGSMLTLLPALFSQLQ